MKARIDPLGLMKVGEIPELNPSSYGFMEADMEKEVDLSGRPLTLSSQESLCLEGSRAKSCDSACRVCWDQWDPEGVKENEAFQLGIFAPESILQLHWT